MHTAHMRHGHGYCGCAGADTVLRQNARGNQYQGSKRAQSCRACTELRGAKLSCDANTDAAATRLRVSAARGLTRRGRADVGRGDVEGRGPKTISITAAARLRGCGCEAAAATTATRPHDVEDPLVVPLSLSWCRHSFFHFGYLFLIYREFWLRPETTAPFSTP